jgi:hypothetical protein
MSRERVSLHRNGVVLWLGFLTRETLGVAGTNRVLDFNSLRHLCALGVSAVSDFRFTAETPRAQRLRKENTRISSSRPSQGAASSFFSASTAPRFLGFNSSDFL